MTPTLHSARGGCWMLCSWIAVLMIFVQSIVPTEAFCPVGCMCDDETLQVTCDEVNLEVIPITLNPSVQRLVLRRNKIKSVDSALRFYLELLYVDFSHNKLVSIQNRSFDAQRKLTELHLDYNKISFVTNGTWSGLRELTILSLRDNFVQNLEERAFGTAPRLRELDLGQNRIEFIDANAFAGLPDLRNLYLDDNRLTYGSPTFPAFLAPIRALAELNLASNELPWLADGLFAALPELSILDVSGCNIRNISSTAFRGLNQLRVLKLHDNLLTHVPTPSLMVLTHLEQLTLGQNSMAILPAHALTGLTKLKQLEINGAAELMSVDVNALSANRDLQAIRLTNCKKLTNLPENVFSHSANLRRLILRDNGLQSLPEKLAPWIQLQSVDLSGNPFNCQCNMIWLRDLLRKKLQGSARSAMLLSSSSTTPAPVTRDKRETAEMQIQSAEVVCSSPLPVANMELHSLSDDQLGCRTSFSSKTVVIALSCAGGLVLLIFTFLLWRFRRKIRQLCSKPHPKSTSAIEHEDVRTLNKWRPPSPTWGHVAPSRSSNNVSLIGNRAPEYHKACTNEEECFMRAVTLHNTLKPFPRTEL